MPHETSFFEADREITHKFVKCFLDIIVIDFLWDREMAGYQLIAAIYDKFGVLLSAGTIYPLLAHLVNRSFLRPYKKGKRKTTYTITEEGRLHTEHLLRGYERNYFLLRETIVKKVKGNHSNHQDSQARELPQDL